MDGHSSRMVIGASAVALALFVAACGDGSDDPPAAAVNGRPHHRQRRLSSPCFVTVTEASAP